MSQGHTALLYKNLHMYEGVFRSSRTES